jgi:hypothetical protein
MKTLNFFFKCAPIWQIFIFWFVLFFLLVSGVFLIFFNFKHMDTPLYRVSFVVSSIFSTLASLILYTDRISKKFWNLSKKIRERIESANTKKDIEDIVNGDFDTLKQISLGQPHFQEIHILNAIMKTKYGLLNS